MVGVAGRSKACHTCRRRRKGCDYARPSCGQCLRLGLDCEGYDRRTTFIHAGLTKTPESNGTHRSPVALPAALTRSAYKTKYMDIFWDLWLPGHSALDLSSMTESSVSTVNWIINIYGQNIYHQSPLLERAVMALCLGTLGKRFGDRHMTEDGIKAYSAALGKMSTVLKNTKSETPPNDDVVAATRCLSMYEVFFGTDSTDQRAQALAWHRHRFGELAFLSVRKPESYVDGIAHQMFADGRFTCTVASLATRKDTVLSRPEWKTVPWSKNKKTPIDLLLDIFVDVPGLLQAYDALGAAFSSRQPNSRELQTKLLQRCTASLRQLHTWLQTSAQDWGWKAHLSDGKATAADITAAHNMCVYWAVEMKVRSIAIDVSLLPLENTSAMARQMKQQYSAYFLQQCAAVIQTAPIFFAPSAGIAGFSLGVFPLIVSHMMLNVVESHAALEMQDEITRLMKESRQSGLAVGSFVDSLWECYRNNHCKF